MRSSQLEVSERLILKDPVARHQRLQRVSDTEQAPPEGSFLPPLCIKPGIPLQEQKQNKKGKKEC